MRAARAPQDPLTCVSQVAILREVVYFLRETKSVNISQNLSVKYIYIYIIHTAIYLTVCYLAIFYSK